MIDEREQWIKLTDSPNRKPSTFSFRPLAVILGLLLGWIALVLVLRAFLPANEQAKVVRGAVYLAYLVVATLVVARSIKRAS